MVSNGKIPFSVFLATANFPLLSVSFTAFQPPKLSIFFTSPFPTPVASPRLSICFEILSLFSILVVRDLSLLERSSTVSSSLPSNPVYTWFASGSVSVVVPSVRNGLFLSRACPLRGSCFPEFAIELVPVAFSVLLAFLPTVAFPSVVSSLGLSTCALGLLRKPLFTVIKSLL